MTPTLPKFLSGSALCALLKYGMRSGVNIKGCLKEIGDGCAFGPPEFDIHMTSFFNARSIDYFDTEIYY